MTQPNSASFTWDIEDYANLQSSASTYISSPVVKIKKTKFWLELYANSVLKNMNNHITIYLIRAKPQQPIDQKVLWTISLINDKGEQSFSKVLETNFIDEYYAKYGGLYHIDRDIIQNLSNGLISDGKLTIKWTVTILDGQNSVNVDDNKKITLAMNKAFENYQSLLESSKFSDVVFVIGKTEFMLHKNILSAQSPVFSAMFENDLEEAKKNRVEITDVDVEVFEVMIRFIYTANVDSVQQYALDLFVAADKYQLDSLKDICADYLGSNLSIDSVANILLVADMHSEAQLKSKCVKYINANASNVVVTDGWKHLLKSRHDLVLDLYYDVIKFEA